MSKANSHGVVQRLMAKKVQRAAIDKALDAFLARPRQSASKLFENMPVAKVIPLILRVYPSGEGHNLIKEYRKIAGASIAKLESRARVKIALAELFQK